MRLVGEVDEFLEATTTTTKEAEPCDEGRPMLRRATPGNDPQSACVQTERRASTQKAAANPKLERGGQPRVIHLRRDETVVAFSRIGIGRNMLEVDGLEPTQHVCEPTACSKRATATTLHARQQEGRDAVGRGL